MAKDPMFNPLLVFVPVLLFGLVSMQVVKMKQDGGAFEGISFSNKMNSDYVTNRYGLTRYAYYDPVRRSNGVKISDSIDQGNCTASSFIAYSIAYDGRRAIKNGYTLSSSQYTSPQFMLDCLGSSRNTRHNTIDNCDGHVTPGRLDAAFLDRVQRQGGIARDSNYKWFGHVISGSQKCSDSGISEKGDKFDELLKFDVLMNVEKDIQLPDLSRAISKGPAVVHINVYPEFLAYDPSENNGILSESFKLEQARKNKVSNYKVADSERWVGYHTLVAVEINRDTKEPYVLLLNTFGTTFGENGYMKIELDLFMNHYLIKSRKVLPFARRGATQTDLNRLDLYLANVYQNPGVKQAMEHFNIIGNTKLLNYPQKIDNLVKNRVHQHFEVAASSPFARARPSPGEVQPADFEKRFIDEHQYDPTMLSVAIKAAKVAFKKRHGENFNIHFDMLLEADQVVVSGRKIHLILFGHRVNGDSGGQRDFSDKNTITAADAGIFEVTLWFPPRRYSASEHMDSITVKGDYEEASKVKKSYTGLSSATSEFQYRVLNYRFQTLEEIDSSRLVSFVSTGRKAESDISQFSKQRGNSWWETAESAYVFELLIGVAMVGSAVGLYVDLLDSDRRKIFEDSNRALINQHKGIVDAFMGKQKTAGVSEKKNAGEEVDDEYEQLKITHQRTSRLPKG